MQSSCAASRLSISFLYGFLTILVSFWKCWFGTFSRAVCLASSSWSTAWYEKIYCRDTGIASCYQIKRWLYCGSILCYYQDRGLDIKIMGNEWGTMGKVPAWLAMLVWNTPKRNITFTICPRQFDHTVLEISKIFSNKSPLETDYVYLKPVASLFRFSIFRHRRITLIPIDSPVTLRILHPSTKVTPEAITQTRTRELQYELVALVGAVTRPCGGLTEMRQEV